MKTFITSLLLFFAISLFAQPQKGDLYVGFSNLQLNHRNNIDFNFSQTTLIITPTFGKFIADNTLIGGGVSLFSNLSSLSTPASSSLGAFAFCSQYLGKGKLKGLTQLSFGSNLTSNDFRSREINSSLALGAAYFMNEFTDIRLLYGLSIFRAIEGFEVDYFPNGVKLNIGLSLRTILLRNREGIENLSALNSIKKGTSEIALSSGIVANSPVNSRSFNGAFSYFFADNLYASAALRASRNKNSASDFDFAILNGSAELGTYLRITDVLYSRISTEVISERNRNNSQFNFIEGFTDKVITTSALRWNSEFGIALFLGRHKLETGIGFRFSGTRLKEIDLERRRDFSSNFFLSHEWFLAENFAFMTGFDTRFNNTNYFVGFSTFPVVSESDFSVEEFRQNNILLNVGFKWYLSTPSE